LTCSQLKQSDSQSPKINFFVIPSPKKDFGCQILRSADDGDHISAFSSEKGAFADAKIDEFDLPGERVIQYVIRLDISVADVPLVDVADGCQQLLNDVPEFSLVLDGLLAETLEGEVLHDEIGEMLLEVEVEGVVLDDAGMPQIFDADEVALQLEDVLGLHGYLLHCVDFVGSQVLAGVNCGVGSLPYLAQQAVLLEKGVEGVPCLFFVLVRKFSEQFLRKDGVSSQLQRLLSSAYLFFLGLHLHAVFGEDGHFAEGSLDFADALLPFRLTIH